MLGHVGKTAIRTLTGPAYQKLKKVPAVTNEEEAQALLTKVLPLYVFRTSFRAQQI